MLIQPLSNQYYKAQKVNFKSKEQMLENFLKPEFFNEQIKQISKANPETQKMFEGLTVLASGILAHLAMFAGRKEDIKVAVNNVLDELGLNNIEDLNTKISELVPKQKQIEKEQNIVINENHIEENFNEMLNADNERKELFSLTKEHFPKLNEQYKSMLRGIIDEPKNQAKQELLDSFELMLKVLKDDEGLKYKWHYFESLNDVYSDCIPEICKNLQNTISKGNTPMSYLVLIGNETITKEEINKWLKFDNFTYNDLINTECITDEAALVRLNKLKEKNKRFEISSCRAMDNDRFIQTYVIKVNFDEGMSVLEKLKTFSEIHQAIYGSIYLKENSNIDNIFLLNDIKTELLNSLIKDRKLDAVYNVAKFIRPEMFANIDLTTKDVKFLDPKSKIYKKIQEKCYKAMLSANTENPKMVELFMVMKDDEIFKGLFRTKHSKLRFISRIVLKDANFTDLREECKQKVDILEKELDQRLNRSNMLCNCHIKGCTPQFYVRNSSLGKYLKITLNDAGSIHTIYEDFNKEVKEHIKANLQDD